MTKNASTLSTFSILMAMDGNIDEITMKYNNPIENIVMLLFFWDA